MEEKRVINKSNLNFIIDAILLILLSGILGVGLLIKYVLLTGHEKVELFGANIEQTIFGLDRHQWGDIHLYVGFAFLILMILHIIFHWRMILSMFNKLFEKLVLKKTLSSVFLSVCVLLILLPLFLKPVAGPVQYGERNMTKNGKIIGETYSVNIVKDTIITNTHTSKIHRNQKETSHRNTSLGIRGYMTLKQVCNQFGLSTSSLKAKLNIDNSISDDTPLSKIRQQYSIKMSKINDVIKNMKSENL